MFFAWTIIVVIGAVVVAVLTPCFPGATPYPRTGGVIESSECRNQGGLDTPALKRLTFSATRQDRWFLPDDARNGTRSCRAPRRIICKECVKDFDEAGFFVRGGEVEQEISKGGSL